MAATSTRWITWGARAPTCPERSACCPPPSPILGHVRTGILGGTFDPIHIAHLRAGEVALHQAGLDRVVFLPAGDPWQKSGRRVSPAAHRLAMVRLAVTGVEGFQVDDREMARQGPTYTAETLASFPDDEELFLVLGADTAAGISTWHRPRDVLRRAKVLVVPRSGVEVERALAAIPSAVLLDMAMLEISGSEIREMARTGGPFRFLVPDAVYQYIQDNSLYAEGAEHDMVGTPTDLEEQS